MRGAGGAVVLLLLAASVPLALPGPARGVPPPVRPAATPPYDIAPWSVGDWWTYDTRVITASPDGTRTNTRLQVNDTVRATETVTVLGTTYTAYNSTVNGTATSNGQLVLGGNPAQYQASGPLNGWILNDRSDLALIAENQTTRMQGTIQYLIFTFRLWMNATTTARHGPAQEDLDFPLELGDAWSYGGILNTTGFIEYFSDALGGYGGMQSLANEGNASLQSWFNTTQSRPVPAGTFPDAAWIHSDTGGGTVDRWYDPAVRNYVAAEIHDVNGPNNYTHVWLNLTGYGLAPAPWPGTISLNPKRVDPGGQVVANGSALPNEDLFVRIPAIGAMYPVQSDATGAWSYAFRAPSVDDYTPSNADVGSHGVLIEPAAASPGSNVTTLQLILPDLYTGPGDLVLSDPTPSMGVNVTVNGTVHAGTAVGVSSPFDVSFTVDGGEIGRSTCSGLAADGMQTFSISWTPSPGSHTVAFVADPDRQVREADEANNTAWWPVFVTGPDLAPMDVVIASDANVTYPDPFAVGGVSAPVQARLGATINVTFQVANVGTANVTANSTIAVVETAVLRGPPVRPRILEATAVAPLAPGARGGPWTASWPVPAWPGVYYLNVTVDADAQVAESSESNNTFVIVVNVSGPDYRIAWVDVPAKVTTDSVHQINVTVRNDGDLAADRSVTLAAYAGMASLPFATATIPPLAVAEAVTATLSWTAPSVAGNMTLRFVVDSTNVLDEMVETNNDATATVDVRWPPITQIAVGGRNVTTTALFVTSTATFVLTATDRSDTGVTTWFRIDAGSAVAYAGPFSIPTEGPHTIAYWSVDNLGGREANRTFAVSVDDSPPTTRATAPEPTGDRRTVTLNATDDRAPLTGVGVAYTQYRIDDGNWTDYTGPFTVQGYGDHTITVRSVDLLGHVEPDQRFSLTITRISPAVNLKPLLAAVFAAVLLAAGLVLGRRKRWSVASPRGLGVAFAVVEGATGVASAATGALAVPPLGAGLAVDLAIFLAGLAGILLVARRGPPPTEPAEPVGAGTDK